MSADTIVLTAESADAFAGHAAASRTTWVFWLALACAAAVHVAFILGIGRSAPRYLGDPGGSSRAIDVELIDEADLRERTAALNPPAAPPPAVGAFAQPALPTAQPPQPDAARPSEPAPAQQRTAVPALEAEQPQAPPDAAAEPSPPEADANKAEAKKQSATKPAQKPPAKQAPKPPAQLDLSVPFDLTMQGAADGGGSSSATRPPGITRSGENDRFGRDVIRALKKMMPPPRGMFGRVTIRLFLNERGNVANIRLVQSGGNRDLDHDVVFSAHQASFPFPPKGATVADRTFLVTYVYR